MQNKLPQSWSRPHTEHERVGSTVFSHQGVLLYDSVHPRVVAGENPDEARAGHARVELRVYNRCETRVVRTHPLAREVAGSRVVQFGDGMAAPQCL